MMTVAETAPSEVALSVGGMNCASCVAHVEKAAREVPGVEACQVNLARGRAVVRYDSTRTDPEHVASAITQSGYTAAPEASGLTGANAEEQRLQHQMREARAWFSRALVGVILWLPLELLHWILYATGNHSWHGTRQ